MKRAYIILFLVLSFLSFNCQKEVGHDDPGRPGNNAADPVTATIQGNVVDENGVPAASVIIKVGSKAMQTDEKGYFRIINASLDKAAAVVTAEKSGYFKAFRTFQATDAANHVKIKMIRRKLAGTISAGGGEVVLFNGSKISLPASSVVKAAGGSYDGDVRVYAAFIDPTANDIGAAMPGSFIADNADGNRVILASFGMMAVELESAAGEKLQIAKGKEALLSMSIPASLQPTAPASISLWYVDEQSGIWKEDGKAERSGNTYIGRVKHFSFWNCDIGLPTVNLKLSLKTEKGLPLVHTSVRINGFVNGGPSASYGYTDSLGNVSGQVLAGQPLTLEVLNDECNSPIYTSAIGPLATNTNLGTITIAPGATTIVTISGKLINCSGAPVTNGSAMINIDNFTSYASTDQKGEFSMAYVKCKTGQQQITITAIDNSAVQQGSAGIFSVGTFTELNTGNLMACGVSAAEFIEYTVDGTNYQLNNLNTKDSIYFRVDQQGQPSDAFIGRIDAYDFNAGRMLQLSFRSPAQDPGTYPAERLSVNQYGTVEPVNPTTITITKYPKVPGDFAEGSFSGSFRDSVTQSPTRLISGTFRLRRE